MRDTDIAADDKLDDGLPLSLAANIDHYGLKLFKLKINGDLDHDLARLQDIAEVIMENCPGQYRFTLDGNEQFRDVASFQRHWEQFQADDILRPFLEQMIFVEQPLNRKIALEPSIGEKLQAWENRPPMIIDEADGENDSLRVAPDCGYQGVSHKNCKGIFRGVANRCLLSHRQKAETPGAHPAYFMSGEDLANIGPVAVLQDLMLQAVLGNDHVERNGHHYFSGLSGFPENVQQAVLHAHPDLYEKTSAGWPTLQASHGQIQVSSIIDAPFGCGFPVLEFGPEKAPEWNLTR